MLTESSHGTEALLLPPRKAFSESDPLADTGKFGNAYWRWTILYALLIFLIATFPFWMSFIIPDSIIVINCIVLLIFALIWGSIAFNAVRNLHRLETAPLPSVNALSASLNRQFSHIVIVPCYLDPIEVLFDCLGSLLMQPNASSLIVVVAFEAKTPDLLLKEKTIYEAFHQHFTHLIISIHTVDRQNEIAGGCSNKNYALRQAYQYIQKNELKYSFNKHSITITTCDTDSLFHPNYFRVLEMVYNQKNPVLYAKPANVVWQSPLFYNWDLDERPFFNRVTCLMRSMMMLGGLISFNLNPMSVFSYPLELGLQVGFINPRYGVDDIIAKVRWMCLTNEQVPIELLPIPSISGPTIGQTIVQEYDEWARQIRRWIIGSSESFHYFVIHFQGKPFFYGLQWFLGFFTYYAVLLCCAGIYSLLATLPYPWVMNYDITLTSSSSSLSFSVMTYLGLVYFLFQYVIFGIAFYIDYKAKQLLTVKENHLYWWKNLLHWLSAPIVLLIYSLIAFCSIVSFIWKGKKMARHDMAAKAGLEKSKGVTMVVTDIPVEEERKQVVVTDNNDIGGFYNDEQTNNGEKRRSTSTSKDLRNSKLLPSSGAPKVNQERKDGDGNQLLCYLPDKFYFGEYCYHVPKIGGGGGGV
mmetsp:Transcript_28851/g.31492  ORF Transcript_28851/g.31492 Transcript_28851/m.31492 type:complete len:638 (+) Transcript_28851:51-1964(+)|eukprot:gene16616-18912_t